MVYGFIGAGNMASAIIKGLCHNDSSSVYVFDTDKTKLENLKETYKANICSSSGELIDYASTIIFAVKPNILPIVLKENRDKIFKKRPLIISIAAGKKLSFIEDYLDPAIPIIRVMPNINAKVGCSISGICKNNAATAEDLKTTKELFKSIGEVIEITEDMFSIFGAIASSSPAFSYLYIDCLARAAQKVGMNKNTALNIAAQAVLGSAKMILESDEHPWALIDQVCSPGGTTIEGIYELEKNSFESTIIKAVDRVLEKDKIIQKDTGKSK